jgi:hypothetical protein
LRGGSYTDQLDPDSVQCKRRLGQPAAVPRHPFVASIPAVVYCPGKAVTRGQIAAFLVRAMGYTDDGGGDLFNDDDDSVFRFDIDRLATAGVTLGCNPPTNDMFCPNSNVTRGQMAAFLHRALG